MHSEIGLVVAVIAGLLVVIAALDPLAAKLRIAPSVLLAVVGIAIGFLSAAALGSHAAGGVPAEIAEMITGFPISAEAFIAIFLPLLLFQTCLNIELRQIAEDAGPIFVMAVLAVVVATLAIGFVLHPLAAVPLTACLLLGAIVATTDPVAVVAIFHDIGAPGRLSRLVEGESLLNDAAAITLFILFLDLLLHPSGHVGASILLDFAVTLVGGAVLGFVIARLFAVLFAALREQVLAQVSLSLALPYLAYLLGDHIGVSGVVAVVAAGLTLGVVGPPRATPEAWRHLREVWEQLDYWASSLVFVLAAILVPKLLVGLGWHDLVLLAALVAAALAARAAILYGLLPLLSAIGLSPPVEPAYRLVILWGGLRGAMTLALALSVVENAAIPVEVQRFVAILATGFVLFTLLVQGTTMRPLMRALKLDRLSPLDLALRREVLGRVRRDVTQASAAAAAEFGLAALAVEAPEAADAAAAEGPPLHEERLVFALVTIARREKELIVHHLEERTISVDSAMEMLAGADRLIDRARTGGLRGYEHEAAGSLAFGLRFALAQRLHRLFGWEAPLSQRLARRLEKFLIRRMVLAGLAEFVEDQVGALLSARIAEVLKEVVAKRRDANDAALEALRLQYPDYAAELERRFLRRLALRHEEVAYDRLFAEALIGPELHRDLKVRIEEERREARKRPGLDLGLDTRTLLSRLPILAGASDGQIEELCGWLTTRLATPGEILMKKGEEGDEAFFISSGAVEVRIGGRAVRLGRGDIVGERALLRDLPRNADVVALAYCSLLVLRRRDFSTFLGRNPALSTHIETVASGRERENQAALGGEAMA
ncbi:MAG TPA: cation:proton antiporter [Hyphomicrobiales bacterium]|nr:cation:proton antiporter [Hyphomicrobiales bacterium]